MLNDDFFKQDLYQRIYKLKNVINGPKVEAPEPNAINDPITVELITDKEEIKRVSLEHNVICYKIWYKLNENARISVKTSVGESKSKIVKDSIGQGSGGASLVSSLNLGCAIEDTFENNPSTTIGNLNLNALCFQDDISKINDNLEHARKGCKLIDRTLSKNRKIASKLR